MKKRILTPLEKLARRICWIEFVGRPKGETEAGYWASLPAATHRRYVEDARRWAWTADRLHATKSMDIQWAARLSLRSPLSHPKRGKK